MLSELPPPPPEVKSIATFSDGITALSYLPPAPISSGPNIDSDSDNTVAATSWDGTLRVYNTHTGTLVVAQTMESGPLLSMAVVGTASSEPSSSSSASSYLIVTGGLDGSGTYLCGCASCACACGNSVSSGTVWTDPFHDILFLHQSNPSIQRRRPYH